MEADHLSGLIADSGMTASRFDDGRRLISFTGKLRPWDISLWESAGWVCLRTTLLPLPTAHGLRSATMSAALAINDTVALAKIVLGWNTILCVDLEYRIDHLDGTALANLVSLVHRVAEEHYPRLVQVATEAGTHAALAAAYDRSPAAQ